MATTQKRRRKGKVHRAPYRDRLEDLLREDRHTLDEMVAIIKSEFPGEEVSRSGVHRYESGIREFTERMHELETSAKVIAEKYGKNAGDDTSTVLANAMVVLATDTVLKLNAAGDADLSDVRKVSLIAKTAQDTKRVSLAVRKQIEAEAREKALREAANRVETAAQARGLTGDDAAFWREQVLMGM